MSGTDVRGKRFCRLNACILVILVAAAGLLWRATHTSAADSEEIPFRKHTIDLGRSESVTVTDVNRDGRLDIVSGDNWYEQAPPLETDSGPRWIKHHFRDVGFNESYVEDLSDLAIDVNGDGYPDIVSCSVWPGSSLAWWENPQGQNKPWRKVIIDEKTPVEFAFLVDLLNTGKPDQMLPDFLDVNAPLSWYEITGKGTDAHWVRHIVDPHSYGHGIGAGDINKDGRNDIITPQGWFEAPPDPRNGHWIFHHEFDLGQTGFIYVEDVNGDGLPDLVTSLGHDYGIFWYEQKLNPDGSRAWIKHVIDNSWSQPHAMTMVDLFGDGRKELVTGKRLHAHPTDPGANEPLGVYWYEPIQSRGHLQWVKHWIDYSTRTGGGLQIPVVDIDGDGDLDIVVAGKGGLFLFENLAVEH